MTAADAMHLAACAAFGTVAVMAYRYVSRETPLGGAVMAVGIVARAVVGLTLFWISYLDLPFLKGLHSGDGFWILASDAGAYYRAAVAFADGASLGAAQASPSFVRTLSEWMSLVGTSPASALFLNLLLYVLLCVLVVRACRPVRDNVAHAACAICLGAFGIAPVLIAHGSQPLKDDLFAFLAAVTCLSVFALLRVRRDAAARAANRWTVAALLGGLAATAYIIGGIRLYFTALVCVCLIPAVVVFVRRSNPRRLRWSAGVAIATIAVASIGPASMWTVKIQRWMVAARMPLAVGSSKLADRPPLARAVDAESPTAVGAEDPGPRAAFVLWDVALDQIQRSRLRFIEDGGATSIAGSSGVEAGIVRPALIGLATVFVPISIVRAIGWVNFVGGRGLLWVTDIDTLVFDALILASVILVAAHRDRVGPNVPYIWFVVSLGILLSLLLGFVVTNFGTLVRLRMMVAVPLWMLPLAVAVPSLDLPGASMVRSGSVRHEPEASSCAIGTPVIHTRISS